MTAPGDRVGGYVVERALGDGSFATVWLVRHDVLRSRHALKLLDPELASNPRLRERFLAEGRILAQLRHPNLVAVTDVVQDGDRVGLVMELVDGPTLAHLVSDHGALPRATALALVRGVADGMEHAHAAGIVHRDLKPENILVASGPDGPRPVVVDFGIAKVLADASVDAGREEPTRLTVRMGTPRYMAPEQVESSAQVDRRADVFALGAVLYELLLGRHAFDGGSDTEILFHVLNGVRGSTDGLEPAVRALVEQALATRPDDRFPTCRALVEAIDALPPGDDAAPAELPPPLPPGAPSTIVPSLPTIPPVPASPPPARGLLAPVGVALVAVALLAAVAWSLGGPAPTTVPAAEVPPAVVAAPVTPAPPPAPAATPVPTPAPEATAPVSPAPTPTPAAAPPRPPRPSPPPPTDTQVVEAAWKVQHASLDRCAGSYAGTLKVDVEVAAGGRPVAADASASPRSPDVEQCVEKAVRAMRLGQPRASVRHVFTVVLRTER